MNPSLFLAIVFAAGLLRGQDPLPAKAFMLDDHRNVACVDLKALRERGIWEDLEVSVLKLAFQQMAKQAGFPLAMLDRLMMTAAPPVASESGFDIRQVGVQEGNGPLGVPESVARTWIQEKVGAHTVYRQRFGDEILAYPRPELRVFGSAEDVLAVLEGKPRRGEPCADVMSLLSGRGDNLAYVAVDVDNALLREMVLCKLFGEVEWPEGDAPRFLLLRLRAIGEVDDPHLEVEAVVRHGKVAEGVAATEKAITAWIETMQKDPQFRGLKPLWPRVVRKTDRTDATLRVDLGRPREAIGHLALLAVPILQPRAAAAAAEVVVEPVPVPAGEPKKK